MRLQPSKLFARPIDPEARLPLGLTLESGQPVFGPRGTHSSAYAPTGSGKTTCVAVPKLIGALHAEPKRAILVLDPKEGEIAAQTVKAAVAMGRKVAVIDDFGVRPELAEYRVNLNPLSHAISTWRQDPREQLYANETISHALIEEPPDRDMKNFYYRESPRKLIQYGISAQLHRSTALTTPGAVSLLISDPAMLSTFAEVDADEGGPALKVAAQRVLEMRSHEHFAQHIGEAVRALRHWGPGTRLEETGREAQLTHEDLIRENYVIFLVGPMRLQARLGAYYALHLGAFTQALYRKIGGLIVIADEYSNIPVKDLIGEAITTVRSFGGEFHLIAQSKSEVLRRFGEHLTQTIEDNCAVKQWLAFNTYKEAEEISNAMGEEHAVAEALSGNAWGDNLSTNLSLSKQPIMSPAELMAMPFDQQLIHIKGVGFFLAQTLSQQHIAPTNAMLADNPMEGGQFKPDTKITLATPKAAS